MTSHNILNVSTSTSIATSPSTGTGAAYLLQLRGLIQDFTLAKFAAQYLATEVYGLQSPNTLEAKSRDLTSFVQWFVGINGHGDIRGWLPRDTQMYLNHLDSASRAATSINRAFATLRRFARWAHEQPGNLFAATGLPTRGVKALAVDEPDCKKLDGREIHALFKAADALVLTEERKNARPKRNAAILALLYHTGLRVSELVGLRRDQYDGRYLLNVKRKGKARSKGLYVASECRTVLDGYLGTERLVDATALKGLGAASDGTATDIDTQRAGLVLPTRGGAFMTRRMVGRVLEHLAEEASKHRDSKLVIHPHRLRHTFGAEYRARTGSDTETAAALGHTGLQYVGRYVRRSLEERENVLESFRGTLP